MFITLLYFHRAREASRRALEPIDLPEGATAGDALAWAVGKYPPLAEIQSVLRLAVNEEYRPPETPLRAGDMVAFLPPVSGG